VSITRDGAESNTIYEGDFDAEQPALTANCIKALACTRDGRNAVLAADTCRGLFIELSRD
jgi:hypothetical protein